MAAWSFWGIFGMFLKHACRKWNLLDTRMSAPFAKKIASRMYVAKERTRRRPPPE